MERHIIHQMREVEDRHWWFAGRRAIVGQLLSALPLPPAARILDMGCGSGGNLALLAEFGAVTGIEPCPMAAALARERRIGRILEGSLPDGLPAGLEPFHAAVLLDVLEHIDEDRASLRALARLLVPGGHLVITVPAFAFLWSRHDVVHHHRRRYSAHRLRACIEQAPLEVVHISHCNTLLFPAVASVRLFERWLPERANSVAAMPPEGPLNEALKAIYRAERHVVLRHRVPFGVSLLALARKPPRPGHRWRGI